MRADNSLGDTATASSQPVTTTTQTRPGQTPVPGANEANGNDRKFADASQTTGTRNRVATVANRRPQVCPGAAAHAPFDFENK